jgi:hypothetical protein
MFSARNVYSQQHGDRKSTDDDGVYGVEIFMSFSFVWVVYAIVDIVGCWMTMWQGSCHVKCSRQKSRGGAAKG